jgi:hypothetical protein
MFMQSRPPPARPQHTMPVSCAVVWAGEEKPENVASGASLSVPPTRGGEHEAATCLFPNFFSEPRVFFANDQGTGKPVSLIPQQHLQAVDSLRRNALHYAAARDDVLSIADLCDRGINCSLQDTRGHSAVHVAVQHGAHRALQTLLESRGTLCDAQNNEGETALLQACQRGDEESASLLLRAGAGPNIQSGEGSPLHFAASNGHLSLAKLLIDAGAFVNAVDASGDTPLHWAARAEQVAMCNLIATHVSANVSAKNEDGETAEELAHACGLAQVAAAIAAAAAGKKNHVANNARPPFAF